MTQSIFDKFSDPMRNAADQSGQAGRVALLAVQLIRESTRMENDPPILVTCKIARTWCSARNTYVARRGMQLHRGLPDGAPINAPVGAVLGGRRNNPPNRETGIRSLAVYSPLHYQEAARIDHGLRLFLDRKKAPVQRVLAAKAR